MTRESAHAHLEEAVEPELAQDGDAGRNEEKNDHEDVENVVVLDPILNDARDEREEHLSLRELLHEVVTLVAQRLEAGVGARGGVADDQAEDELRASRSRPPPTSSCSAPPTLTRRATYAHIPPVTTWVA